jgi:hypothetical protein
MQQIKAPAVSYVMDQREQYRFLDQCGLNEAACEVLLVRRAGFGHGTGEVSAIRLQV